MKYEIRQIVNPAPHEGDEEPSDRPETNGLYIDGHLAAEVAEGMDEKVLFLVAEANQHRSAVEARANGAELIPVPVDPADLADPEIIEVERPEPEA